MMRKNPVKPITYFLPREEVKNCFHVIKEALDKFGNKNTTGSLETTLQHVFYRRKQKEKIIYKSNRLINTLSIWLKSKSGFIVRQ